jgi:hypothetical protein
LTGRVLKNDDFGIAFNFDVELGQRKLSATEFSVSQIKVLGWFNKISRTMSAGAVDLIKLLSGQTDQLFSVKINLICGRVICKRLKG